MMFPASEHHCGIWMLTLDDGDGLFHACCFHNFSAAQRRRSRVGSSLRILDPIPPPKGFLAPFNDCNFVTAQSNLRALR